MDNEEELLQRASIDIVNKYPYISYLLRNILDNYTVFDSIPDNLLDYMMADLDAGRITDFGMNYKNDGYYELVIGFQNYELDVKFTYTFKISEELVILIQECVETLFGEPINITDTQLKQPPKLKVLKGGKKD